MEETSLLIDQESSLEQTQNRYFQVDLLKAIMIFLVIFDHIVAWNLKSLIAVAFWERISIPIFLIIMGFNMGLSLERSGAETLKELYSKQYFKKKVFRYVVPFAIYYGISTLVGLMMYNWNFVAMWENQYSPNHGIINLFIGFIPFWGPGNWFIPLLLQSVLLLPLLYWLFKKNPKFALILCLLMEVIMQLLVFLIISEITTWEEVHLLTMFQTSILFYTPAVGIGLWFSMGHQLKDKRNWFLLAVLPITIVYMIFYQFFGFRILIDGVPLIRGDYNFIIVPYSAVLFLLVLNYVPSPKPDSRLNRVVSTISKSTYHILLIQMLGYGMIYAFFGTHYIIHAGSDFPIDILNLVVLWAIFIPWGVWWQKIEHFEMKEKKFMHYVLLFISFLGITYLLFFIGQVT